MSVTFRQLVARPNAEAFDRIEGVLLLEPRLLPPLCSAEGSQGPVRNLLGPGLFPQLPTASAQSVRRVRSKSGPPEFAIAAKVLEHVAKVAAGTRIELLLEVDVSGLSLRDCSPLNW
jgi:hypothetical protein